MTDKNNNKDAAAPRQEEVVHLTKNNQDADLEDLLQDQQKQQQQVSSQPNNVGLGTMLNSYCAYCVYVYPKTCLALVLVCITFAMLLFGNAVLNPTETFGEFHHDFTTVSAASDLYVGDIDHWCIKGDNDSCRCEDPLEPTPRAEFKSWMQAHLNNKRIVKQAPAETQVAFLGESLIEEMDGRWMGRPAPSLETVQKTFEKHFVKGNIKALALGVAGDTSPNVLWRVLNGEAPKDFNPKIWWLSLGMNDLGRMQCSEEVVVMGILNVVEQLRALKPDATIVINSMLPMADLRGGVYPLKQDFQDAFKNKKFKKNQNLPKSMYARPTTAAENGKTPNNNNQAKEKNNNKKNRFLRKEQVVKKNQENDKDQPFKITKKEKKQFRKKIKKDPFNPKINEEQSKIKKYNAKQLFLKQNRLPLWTSIVAMNRQLKQFCQKQENNNIMYFEATPLFTEMTAKGQVLLSERISIRGHPTNEGYQVWEDKVKIRIETILKRMNKIAEEQDEVGGGAKATLEEKKDKDKPKKELQNGN